MAGLEKRYLTPFTFYIFNAYDPKIYGSKSPEDYMSMYKYYSKEDEEKYGVLAIHLQVV